MACNSVTFSANTAIVTNQVKVGYGVLNAIMICDSSGTRTLTLYDTDSKDVADPKLILSFVPTASMVINLPDEGVIFNKGLYIEADGAAGVLTGSVIFK